MGILQEVRVPDIGDFKNVPVIEVLVAPGDTVRAETPLIVLESDKATLEVPAPSAGVVKELRVKLGDRLSQGSLVLLLESAGDGAAASAPSAVPEPVAAPPVAVVSPLSPTPPAAPRNLGEFPARASPALRQLTRQLGVDLSRVRASGPRGRITREDIQAYVKQELAAAVAPAPAAAAPGNGLNLLPWPQVDFSKFGPVERRPLSRIKKISGANLGRNWVMIPHVTNFDEADVTELEAFRTQFNREQDKGGAKLTMLAFLIKACAGVLRKYPEFNASLDGEELVYKGYYHVGFAAETPNGLVVPVIRDADRKGLLQIARETAELAALAREGKLKPADMQGGCFSISSLGGIGGTHFTPIINAPEVAILGVGKARERLAREDERIVSRLILPLSLSWDHRVVDGAAAGRFNTELARVLADFRRVVL